MGIVLGRVGEMMHNTGIYILAAITLLVLVLPSIIKPSSKPINHVIEE